MNSPTSPYEQLQERLRLAPKRWVLTGAAGFIGSNLLEALLALDQHVVGLDNFSSGYERNLDEVRSAVSASQWGRFRMLRGDIANPETCREACAGADFVLHQAALGSVPGSIEDPLRCHNANVTGFLNVLLAARDARVKNLVYASSSAVYGDDPALPKTEEKTGQPLSPYAASKAMDEIYAGVFARAYAFPSIGLRYFNVFGPRQDPNGAYAAVIPCWIAALLSGQAVAINGDGETSRDFCYITNVVQANLIAATTRSPEALNQVYNIALGQRTTLNQLFTTLQTSLQAKVPSLRPAEPVYREFRAGDIRHSVADISKARRLLGYVPSHSIAQGLDLAMDWYRRGLA